MNVLLGYRTIHAIAAGTSQPHAIMSVAFGRNMIVPHRLHVWKLVRYIAPALGILFAYDMLVVLLFYNGWTWVSLPHVPLSLFGTAIGVILGFRNNTAYQRWWEARILWGAIVNS